MPEADRYLLRDSIDLRQLRYFVAVAEDLNYRQAAERLCITQAPLSRGIQALERRLDVQLLKRDTRGVALTEAGRALLPRAKSVLRQIFEIETMIAQRRAQATVVVGYPLDTSARILATLSSHFHQSIGPATGHLQEASTVRQLRGLKLAYLDIGILRGPVESEDVIVHAELHRPLGIVMKSGHPLTELEVIPVDRLTSETLVFFPRAAAPGLHDDVLDTLAAGGYRPGELERAIGLMTAVMASDSKISIGWDGQHREHRGLEWRPVEPPLTIRTLVVVRKGYRGAYAAEVADLVTGLLTEDGWHRVR